MTTVTSRLGIYKLHCRLDGYVGMDTGANKGRLKEYILQSQIVK